jgi:hypothetical protein
MKPVSTQKFYVLYRLVVGIGLGIIGISLYRVIHDQIPGYWLIMAALAFIAGSFSLKIPGMNGRVSAGDSIICLCLLLFGPFAGAITAAVDALGGSLRCKTSFRRLHFALYNSTSSAVSALAAGSAALALLGKPMLFGQTDVLASSLLLPLLVMASAHYLLNTGLVAGAVAAEKSLNFLNTWRDGFMWTCVNYMASSFVAGILAQVPTQFWPEKLIALAVSCLTLFISSKAHIRLAQP